MFYRQIQRKKQDKKAGTSGNNFRKSVVLEKVVYNIGLNSAKLSVVLFHWQNESITLIFKEEKCLTKSIR